MKKELTFVNLVIILHILFYGSLLLVAKIEYWSFLDWLTQPLAEFDTNAGADRAFNVYSLTLFLVYTLTDIFKAGLFELLAVFDQYDFARSLRWINASVLIIAVLYFITDTKKLFSQISVAACLLILLVSILTTEAVSKADVDEGFSDYAFRDITGINYMNRLRQGDYAAVEDAFSKVHDHYNAGNLSEGEYDYEFVKFAYATVNDLEHFNEWVENAGRKDIALMVRGSYFQQLGWNARGAAYISKTSPERISEMKRLYALAVQDHKEALELNEKLLYSYISLIRIASSIEIQSSKRALFDEAKALFPYSYILAYVYSKKIIPKWGGSFGEVRALALHERESAQYNPMLISIGGTELYDRGYTLYNNKDYWGAIDYYKKALLYGPTLMIYTQIYRLYDKLGDHEAAKEIMDDCLTVRARNTRCLVFRAEKNIDLLDGDAALADATAASGSGDLSADLHNRLGWVFKRIAYYEQAQKHFIAAVELDPVNSYALKNLYKLSYEGHIPYNEVLPYFEKSVELEPDNADFWIQYADTLEDIDRKSSVAAYKKYLDTVDRNDGTNNEAIMHVVGLIQQIESE